MRFGSDNARNKIADHRSASWKILKKKKKKKKQVEYILDEMLGAVSHLNLALPDKEWAETVTSPADLAQRVRNILNCHQVTC